MILISCGQDDLTIFEEDDVVTIGEEDLEFDTETLLFQMEYINFAWGYQHSGWFINNEGEVRRYTPQIWKIADKDGYFDLGSLRSNYNQATEIIGQVDMHELKTKALLIEGTLNGELGEMNCPGADQGSFTLYCYFWDEEKQKYKQQFLSVSGDCNQQNSTNAAKVLTDFLSPWKNYVFGI